LTKKDGKRPGTISIRGRKGEIVLRACTSGKRLNSVPEQSAVSPKERGASLISRKKRRTPLRPGAENRSEAHNVPEKTKFPGESYRQRRKEEEKKPPPL